MNAYNLLRLATSFVRKKFIPKFVHLEETDLARRPPQRKKTIAA